MNFVALLTVAVLVGWIATLILHDEARYLISPSRSPARRSLAACWLPDSEYRRPVSTASRSPGPCFAGVAP